MLGGDNITIIFGVRNVREYLLSNGIVFTIRTAYHDGIENAVYYDHGWKNLGKVKCEFISLVSAPEDLAFYVKDSGFNFSVDWFELAIKIHKKRPLILYKVTLVK